MSLAFPLSIEQFLDALPVGQFAMDCPERVEVSVTAGGEWMARETGPRLWQGSIVLGRMTPAEAAEATALIDLVRGSGGRFLAYDMHRPWPVADPAGQILGAATPTITAIDTDRRSLSIGGLPAGYVLGRGDLIGLSYGAGPLRQTLHRIVSGQIADGAGQTGLIEVVPALQDPIVAASPVVLGRPPVRAMIVPGNTRPGRGSRFVSEGASFSFVQTMK